MGGGNKKNRQKNRNVEREVRGGTGEIQGQAILEERINGDGVKSRIEPMARERLMEIAEQENTRVFEWKDDNVAVSSKPMHIVIPLLQSARRLYKYYRKENLQAIDDEKLAGVAPPTIVELDDDDIRDMIIEADPSICELFKKSESDSGHNKLFEALTSRKTTAANADIIWGMCEIQAEKDAGEVDQEGADQAKEEFLKDAHGIPQQNGTNNPKTRVGTRVIKRRRLRKEQREELERHKAELKQAAEAKEAALKLAAASAPSAAVAAGAVVAPAAQAGQ